MKKRPQAARAKTARRAPATKVRARSEDKSDAKSAVVALPAECTIADADALKLRLAKLLSHEQTVTLNRAAIQRIDTATLQMLAAFTRDRRAKGLAVEWSGDAPAFTSAVSLLGLNSLI